MTTIVVEDKSAKAQQFLAFARTLPYVDVVQGKEESKNSELKKSVKDTLRKAEKNIGLNICKNTDEMFKQLDI